ncbi:hypothetical protein VT84_33325 [Gemmata sp. SH-PL17]|uniref:hypothetical protein n=1 Tax=Gemmata sp. SH-PL17 TaxID=1630693 RepID=UPI00078CC113|nr:hypothetical protein [Gemmata sp. SH-PL17]AMV29324.1 hypothetical protein VT84_33325 [Gemmata sp. SH-PL17]
MDPITKISEPGIGLPENLVPPTDENRDYLIPAEIATACRTDHMTVLRWLNMGITARDANGRRTRVRLEGVKIGGRWKIPVAKFEAFVRATSGMAFPTAEKEPRESEAQRKVRVAKCLERLAAQGMLS